MGLSDNLNSMKGVKYSFEELKGQSRYDMADQFGHSGVKAYLYEKKFQSGDESLKDTKEYQQNLLAQKSGFSNYREMGEALRKGKLTKQDVLRSFRELEDEGLINPENFILEKKDSLSDKLDGIKKYADPKTSFVMRNDIQQKLLKNEINSYAKEEGFVDENNDPDTLLFLQAVDSGDYQDGRAESLIERYRGTFNNGIGYAGPDYENYKDQNNLNQGEYTVDNISKRIRDRF